MSNASRERLALADALRQAGPDEPTLCEGWTTRDLAAHLVVRESRPDTGLGVLVPLFSGWTDAVRRRDAERDFGALVDDFAGGPPRLSPIALPGVDARANLTEFFIHCEDVRRARPGWRPRDLDPRYERALWDAVSRGGRLLFRRSPVGVVLQVPGGPRRRVRPGGDSVVLTGAPGELLMHASGRPENAQVEVSGSEVALRAYSGTRLDL